MATNKADKPEGNTEDADDFTISRRLDPSHTATTETRVLKKQADPKTAAAEREKVASERAQESEEARAGVVEATAAASRAALDVTKAVARQAAAGGPAPTMTPHEHSQAAEAKRMADEDAKTNKTKGTDKGDKPAKVDTSKMSRAEKAEAKAAEKQAKADEKSAAKDAKAQAAAEKRATKTKK